MSRDFSATLLKRREQRIRRLADLENFRLRMIAADQHETNALQGVSVGAQIEMWLLTKLSSLLVMDGYKDVAPLAPGLEQERDPGTAFAQKLRQGKRGRSSYAEYPISEEGRLA